MISRSPSVLAVVLMASAATPVLARGADSPAALQKVFDCRALTDSQARLACFDASVGQLSEARSRGDIAMVDREQVKETKKRLFGFSLPNLNLFGRKDDGDQRKEAKADEVEEVTGKVKAVGRTPDGGWVIVLEDGARWEQTGTMTFGRNPKPGSIATIKRAALGSFKMSIDGSPSVKAKRSG